VGIIAILREQWAGLFQRLLESESRLEDYKISANLKSTAELLQKLVQYTTTERDETIKSILASYHPVFNQIATLTGIKIRIVFYNEIELQVLLEDYEFELLGKADDRDLLFQRHANGRKDTLVVFGSALFDSEGKLLPVEPDKLDIRYADLKSEELPPAEDDVPF